jgi:uncharacterized membrane protein
MKTTAKRWFLILFSASLLQMLLSWPLMPERMASHFDGAGNPNGWQSRSAFFGLSLGVMCLLACCFRVLPSLLHRLPDSLINLPNKDVWLSPGQRKDTFALLEDRLVLFGNATLLFLMALMQLVTRANLDPARRMSSGAIAFLLAFYLFFAIAWTVGLLLRFRKPPKPE